MAETYVPREGGLAHKLLQHLQANPDAKLDANVIAEKFEMSRLNIHTLLSPAMRAGLLHRAVDPETTELVYSLPAPGTAAGDGTGGEQQLSPFKSWLSKQGQDSAEGRPKRRPARAETGKPAVHPPPAASARVRFGVFSDGALQLEEGEICIRMTPAETRVFNAYLQRALQQLEGGHDA